MLGPDCRIKHERDEMDSLLSNTYRSILITAQTHQLQTIAIPCISTGIFKFPNDRASMVVLHTIRAWLSEQKQDETVPKVILCMFGQIDLQSYLNHWREYFPNISSGHPSNI